MRVERTPRALCLYVPDKHWAKVVLKISGRVPVGIGHVRGDQRILCLPPETTDDEAVAIMTDAGFMK